MDATSDTHTEQFSMVDPTHQTEADVTFVRELDQYFPQSLGTTVDKLRNFAKFVPRQSLSLFLAKHEMFKHVLRVHGHIIECGVYLGGGIATWAQLSSIFEPVNHVRRVVGFDAFTGFPEIGDKDCDRSLDYVHVGGLATHAQDDLTQWAKLYDLNRPLGHIPRIELVCGDAVETIPQYVQDNPHLVVAMLYLDFDLYEPTKVAIEQLMPRMPKGAVVAFDELDQKSWPGETQAVLDSVGLRHLRIERFPYTPQLSFAVLD